MKHAFFTLVIGFGVFAPVRSEETKADRSAPLTILFLGDSITAAGGYVKEIDAGLTRLNPGNPPKVINRGRSSETTSDLSEAYHPGRRPCLLARLDRELAETKPDWVVACYGINDGIYHPFNEKRFAAYQAGIEAFINRVQAAGARVILITPPPFARPGPFPEGADAPARAEIVKKADAAAEAAAEKDPNKFGWQTPYAYYDEVMARYARWLLGLNGRKDVWVVDVRTPMLAKVRETHGGDPIHPNGLGHSIMAEAFLRQWPAIEARVRGR
jgi:lysophospholipase L1-like esterase